MTKFKAGDKVFIHDEELTNPEGPSMYQTYRGTEGKIRGRTRDMGWTPTG